MTNKGRSTLVQYNLSLVIVGDLVRKETKGAGEGVIKV